MEIDRSLGRANNNKEKMMKFIINKNYINTKAEPGFRLSLNYFDKILDIKNINRIFICFTQATIGEVIQDFVLGIR